MAYERALRLLARLEAPKPAGMSAHAYKKLLQDLVESKYRLVVASQVGGRSLVLLPRLHRGLSVFFFCRHGRQLMQLCSRTSWIKGVHWLTLLLDRVGLRQHAAPQE